MCMAVDRSMRSMAILASVVCTVLLLAATVAHAARAGFSGEQYVYAATFTNRNFTGWSEDGSQTEDAFAIWQRLRLRSDYAASDALAFSLWLQADNTPWGNGFLTVDAPAVAVQVFQAFLKFSVPGTRAEVTAGKFTTTLPQSGAFSGSAVLDTEYPSLAVRLPLSDSASLVASYGRLFSYANALEDVSAHPRGLMDLAAATLETTFGDVEFTPWAAAGLLSRAGASTPYAGADGPPDLGYIRRQLLSTGYFTGNPGFRRDAVPYFWAGFAFKAKAGDVNLYADLAAASGGLGDSPRNTRRGVFADAAVEYAGFSRVTPRLCLWWGSGEDADTGNGSERLPTIVRTWNPGVSYLFSTGQAFDNTTSIDADPTGSWGAAAVLDGVSLVEGLSSRLTFAFMGGTSDPAPFRRSVAVSGPGYMAVMGKNLVLGEYLLGASFDHEYAVAGGLKLVAETGWARAGGLDASVWGRRFVNAARDSWKVAAGFRLVF